MATVLLLEDEIVPLTVTVTRAMMMMMMMIVKNFGRREDCINTIRSETKAKQIQKQNRHKRKSKTNTQAKQTHKQGNKGPRSKIK